MFTVHVLISLPYYNNIRFKSNGDFGFGVYIFDFEQVIQPTRVGWQQRFPFVIIYIRQLHIYIETLPFTMLLLV